MVVLSTTFLPLQEKVTTRKEKQADPCPTLPHLDRKRKAKWKKTLHLSNKPRISQWIAKTQRAAAAIKSKDLKKT
jgi:hypothetical protein